MTVFCHESGHSDSPAHTALLATVAVTVALCSGCGSNDIASTGGEHARTAMPACDVARPGPPSIDSAFVDHLPRQYTVEEICAADVGPGLASAEVIAELSGLAAGEITSAYSLPGDDGGLKALVGTVKSGNGDAFVDRFLSRVGETRNDTVTLGEQIVRYFNTSGGQGYAYADGPTVAIGYIPPPGEDLAIPEVGVKEVFTRIVAAAAGTPIPAVDWDVATESGIDTYAPGPGPLHHTRRPGMDLLQDRQRDQNGLRNRPQRLRAGCDIVPKRNVGSDGAATAAPSGANQTAVDASAPARYTYSATPTFTRDVDVLVEGHRLDNGDATCGVGYQGTVQCVTGEHSFAISSDFGTLE
jgi:hypothetical protein